MPSPSRSLCADPASGRRRVLRALAGVGVGIACGLPLGACHPPASSQALAAGSPFPEFALAGPDGRMHRSSEYAGAPLLINFWATWCPPCRAEMPDLQELYQRFSGNGLRVLGISIDDDVNLVREFLLKSPVAFPVLLDSRRELAERLLHLNSYPASYLVGRDKVVRELILGRRTWADEEHAELIARRLSLA